MEKDKAVAIRVPIGVTDVATITTKDVQEYICPKANLKEVELFLRVCVAEKLNPFTKEIYLVKYADNQPAAIIIGIESYLKAAEESDEFDGYEAGLIIKGQTALEFREGVFIELGEKLVGGWAKVFRKDRSKPFYSAISLQEAQKMTKEGRPTQFWEKNQATMMRNNPLRRALREAFPNRFRNFTDEDMPETTYRVISENTLPEPFMKDGKENWDLFWAKQGERGLTDDKVHGILGSTLGNWTKRGKTLAQADEFITESLRKTASEQDKIDLYGPDAVKPPDKVVPPLENQNLTASVPAVQVNTVPSPANPKIAPEKMLFKDDDYSGVAAELLSHGLLHPTDVIDYAKKQDKNFQGFKVAQEMWDMAQKMPNWKP